MELKKWKFYANNKNHFERDLKVMHDMHIKYIIKHNVGKGLLRCTVLSVRIGRLMGFGLSFGLDCYTIKIEAFIMTTFTKWL